MFRQYIKSKRHNYGVKLYKLCESNGIVLKVKVYCRKSDKPPVGVSLISEVVLFLMDAFLDKGHSLSTDNFYNSVPLTKKKIIERSTYICGTLRFNRRENPREITKKKLKRGECSWLRSGSVEVCKWKDTSKRDVLSISNMHRLEMVGYTNKNGKTSKKPNIIKDYIDGMSGIDRSDQMMSHYSCLRKTLRWYKKLGIHFLEMYVCTKCIHHFLQSAKCG